MSEITSLQIGQKKIEIAKSRVPDYLRKTEILSQLNYSVTQDGVWNDLISSSFEDDYFVYLEFKTDTTHKATIFLRELEKDSNSGGDIMNKVTAFAGTEDFHTMSGTIHKDHRLRITYVTASGFTTPLDFHVYKVPFK